MARRLTLRERERVRNLSDNDDALRNHIWSRVPHDIINQYQREVTIAMEGEGKTLRRGAANRFGGEHALRVAVMIESWVRAQLERFDSAMQELCVRVDYCAKRRSKTFEEDGYAVAIAVGDGLLQIFTQLPLPIVILSVYIIKRGILDEICRCGRTAARNTNTGRHSHSHTTGSPALRRQNSRRAKRKGRR